MNELEQEIAEIIEKTTGAAGDEVIITSVSNVKGVGIGNRTARKPEIGHLEDAFNEDRVPLFEVGSRIVIERYATTIPGCPWLDTQTYVVNEIDTNSGVMKLWNPYLFQSALTNFRLGLDNGFLFKLAPTRGGFGKKKRGRPPKGGKKVEEKPTGEKKGRGRPKGVKNRAPEVIEAERKARSAERDEKKKRG